MKTKNNQIGRLKLLKKILIQSGKKVLNIKLTQQKQRCLI